jgi:hypothetical protein
VARNYPPAASSSRIIDHEQTAAEPVDPACISNGKLVATHGDRVRKRKRQRFGGGIPLATQAGVPFPDRDLVLFVTFGLIVITLVGQGLLLPSVVRWLGLGRHAAEERDRERKAELAARSEALSVARSRLEQLAAEGQISPEALAVLRARHDDRSGRLPRETSGEIDVALVAAELRSELIAAEREFIYQRLRDGRITDEARRRIERELDLEEAGIA